MQPKPSSFSVERQSSLTVDEENLGRSASAPVMKRDVPSPRIASAAEARCASFHAAANPRQLSPRASPRHWDCGLSVGVIPSALSDQEGDDCDVELDATLPQHKHTKARVLRPPLPPAATPVQRHLTPKRCLSRRGSSMVGMLKTPSGIWVKQPARANTAPNRNSLLRSSTTVECAEMEMEGDDELEFEQRALTGDDAQYLLDVDAVQKSGAAPTCGPTLTIQPLQAPAPAVRPESEQPRDPVPDFAGSPSGSPRVSSSGALLEIRRLSLSQNGTLSTDPLEISAMSSAFPRALSDSAIGGTSDSLQLQDAAFCEETGEQDGAEKGLDQSPREDTGRRMDGCASPPGLPGPASSFLRSTRTATSCTTQTDLSLRISTATSFPSVSQCSELEEQREIAGGAEEEEARTEQPPVERPCPHNDWDDVRTRKGIKVLRCRVCQAQLKVPSARVPRCIPFLQDGTCTTDACGLLHVHKQKRKLVERHETFGEAVLKGVPQTTWSKAQRRNSQQQQKRSEERAPTDMSFGAFSSAYEHQWRPQYGSPPACQLRSRPSPPPMEQGVDSDHDAAVVGHGALPEGLVVFDNSIPVIAPAVRQTLRNLAVSSPQHVGVCGFHTDSATAPEALVPWQSQAQCAMEAAQMHPVSSAAEPQRRHRVGY